MTSAEKLLLRNRIFDLIPSKSDPEMRREFCKLAMQALTVIIQSEMDASPKEAIYFWTELLLESSAVVLTEVEALVTKLVSEKTAPKNS